jgi:hypothetical protein
VKWLLSSALCPEDILENMYTGQSWILVAGIHQSESGYPWQIRNADINGIMVEDALKYKHHNSGGTIICTVRLRTYLLELKPELNLTWTVI